jgi:hypothetical protein
MRQGRRGGVLCVRFVRHKKKHKKTNRDNIGAAVTAFKPVLKKESRCERSFQALHGLAFPESYDGKTERSGWYNMNASMVIKLLWWLAF